MNEPTHFKNGPTICLDFDGVVHEYTSAWTATGEIHDGPVPGAIDFIYDAIDEGFTIAVYSCRCETVEGRNAIRSWLYRHLKAAFGETLGFNLRRAILVPEHKPHADIYIDDRGFRFEGDFPDFDYIRSAKPWNKE